MDICECTKCEDDDEESEDLAKELADAFKFLQTNDEDQRRDDGDDDKSPTLSEESVHFKIRDYHKVEKKEESPRLLDPDHPLLDRFQKALREHLEKQITSLNTEIFELETGAKKKSDERETIGVEAYEMQQTVCQQQKNIEKCMEDLQTLTAAKLETLEKLEETERVHKKVNAEMTELEVKEMQLRNEVKQIDLLLYQMTSWTDEMESDLRVNQRMSEKTRKDKIKLADEKRQLDIIIYKLMTEVWRLENELESIEMQLRVKEQDRERLAEAVVQSNTDIEALESEQRCLMHSWHSVIVAIENRDKHYNAAYKDYQDCLEKVQSAIAEINKVKKLCKTEMLQNENLCMFKTRIETDINMCEHQLEQEVRKRTYLEREMHQIATIINQIDEDAQKLNVELAQRNRELNVVVKEWDDLSTQKVKLEEEVLLKLQDQIINDKASAYMKKLVMKNRQKNMDTEIALANTENQNAKVLNMIENQKQVNLALIKRVEEIECEIMAMNNEIKSTQNDIKKCDNSIKRKEQEYDLLNKKIETYLRKTQGSVLSPQEIKYKTIEKNITETVEINKKLQKFWLREQGHICQLSEQRQEQIKEMNLLKKQTLILQQRNLKINDELESYGKKEKDINQSVENLHNKIALLNGEFCKKKDTTDYLMENNSLYQFDYVAKLKDLELEILSVEDCIEEMENEKVRLSEELIDKNRVRLAWEKKLKMALETKENMRQEKVGELGNIKSEIHRMKVRYAQLRRAQDKLISDMEHCVLRRDTIYTVAEAQERRRQDGSITRVNFLRKLDDLKNKHIQAKNESEELMKNVVDFREQDAILDEENTNLQKELGDLQNAFNEWLMTLEKAKTQKYLNLEILILRQRKLKIYTELTTGRKPHLMYRTESSIISQYDKQKELNNKLMSILDDVTRHLPQESHVFERVYNTLKLPYLFI